MANKNIHKYAKPFTKNDSRINRTGENRNSISKILRELMAEKTINIELTVISESGEKKTNKININSKKSINEVLAVILLQKALAGDLKAICEVIDRTDGKATTQIELTTTDEPEEAADLSHLSFEQLLLLSGRTDEIEKYIERIEAMKD